jgi:hypothetical protein
MPRRTSDEVLNSYDRTTVLYFSVIVSSDKDDSEKI